MFDIILIKNFNNEEVLKFKPTFAELPFYEKLKFVEYNVDLKDAKVVFLERQKTNKNYFNDKEYHFFIYGSVFSNNQYYIEKNVPPFSLNAKDVSNLYREYGLNLTKFIKGSFVLIIYSNLEVILISDRLNVLPLYYYRKNNILIISSSLKLMLKLDYVSKTLDDVSLVQQLIFDYMLDDYTLYKYIKRIKPGSIYIFDQSKMKIKKYWTVENLYNEKLLAKSDSLELLSKQLFDNVQLYTSDTRKILVSLTGGFDGRTNLAMLRKNKGDFLCYSYGMRGSQQISIPQDIAIKLDIPYKPIYCDEKFEKVYIDMGLMVTEFSNGTAPFTQAVLPYAYKNLQNFSDIALTGLFGSEVLRPIHNLGIIINDYSERIFLGPDPKNELKKVLKDLMKINFLNEKIIVNAQDELLDHFYSNYIERFNVFDRITRFFMFIIEEGIRKYFSQEIQAERVFITTRFPYWDDDFIDLIYKTPFAGLYNGFLGKSMFKRRKGQLLYAYILKKYNPQLANIQLDRGYKPNDLLKPFPINYLLIGKGVYKKKKYIAKVGNDTFNTPKWSVPFINFVQKKFEANEYFSHVIKTFNPIRNENLRLKYSHFLSIYNFINND